MYLFVSMCIHINVYLGFDLEIVVKNYLGFLARVSFVNLVYYAVTGGSLRQSSFRFFNEDASAGRFE